MCVLMRKLSIIFI